MTITSGRPAVARGPAPARLRLGDLAGLASIGLRTRKLRAALSALGIAIGVAAIVAVLGLASSSQAVLLAEISELGTNLLTVTNGQALAGGTAKLPTAAPGMIGKLPGVTAVQYTGALNGVNAYRSPYIPAINSNGLSVDAASLGLPAAAGTSVAQGSYLNAATATEPVAVLGYAAAQRLGIDRIWPGERIWVGGMWFAVVGILNSATLAPEIDSAILIGFPAAGKYLGFDGHPSEIYVRTVNTEAATTTVDGLLGAQANPESPSEVTVSQPSQALTAQADAAGAFDTLFLGLGAVALLVGAVGVANIMVISVLERRQEIGLRRALGATRGQIRTQFLSEAILLGLAGGSAGVVLGVISTAVYGHTKGWPIVIPAEAWAGGLGAAVLIGAIAGLLPAIRAARLSPTQALWSLLAQGGDPLDPRYGRLLGVVRGVRGVPGKAQSSLRSLVPRSLRSVQADHEAPFQARIPGGPGPRNGRPARTVPGRGAYPGRPVMECGARGSVTASAHRAVPRPAAFHHNRRHGEPALDRDKPVPAPAR